MMTKNIMDVCEKLYDCMDSICVDGAGSLPDGWIRVTNPLKDNTTTITITPLYSNGYGYATTTSGVCDCGKNEKKLSFDNLLDDVKHVIYNEPATIVTFSDGSKVCVKACEKDTFNKETGLVYAIVKRLYADDVEKNTGYLKSTGLGEKISKIIAKSVDQKAAARERRKKHKMAKQTEENKKDDACPESKEETTTEQ